MKTPFMMLGTVWLMTFSLFSASIAGEGTSEEYVYLLKAEGGKVSRVMERVTGDKKETVRNEIRRMELISPGTILEIEKGASAFLTCGGCRILNVTYKDSPFVVRMEDFRKEGAQTGKLLEYFTRALINFIHPDSKPVSKVHLNTRGLPGSKIGLCKDLLPEDNAEIMLMEPIPLTWGFTGTHLSVEVKEFQSPVTIYSKKTSSTKIDIPVEILKLGRRYEWSLLEEDTGKKCGATFVTLQKEESERVMEIINNLSTLLPPEADMETRCRLQAGYLVSEGLDYDAWKWLERNGISQHH